MESLRLTAIHQEMRISNYTYLHTGKGLSKASKQGRAVYKEIKAREE